MPTPSPKPFPYQHPHIPSRHMGRTTFTTPTIDIDLGVGHNNVIMNGMPSIMSHGSGNQAATVEGGINFAKIKKGILTFTQKKSDGTVVTNTAGSASGGAGTFNITPGQTTIFHIDGGGSQTKTWAGTAAAMTSSGAAYTGLNGLTLQFTKAGDNGHSITVTFDNTCVDRATTITFLNNAFAGMEGPPAVPMHAAPGSGSEIVYSSTVVGTGSIVSIAGGSSTALGTLGLTGVSPTVNGTGDAANLAAVTRVEAAAALNSVLSGATASGSGSNLVVTSNTTTAASSVQLDLGSTQTLGFDNTLHSGNGGPLTIEWSCEVFNPVPVT